MPHHNRCLRSTDDNEFMVEHSACYRTLLKYSGTRLDFYEREKQRKKRKGIKVLSPMQFIDY